jgi:hypothetical protein
MLNQNPITELQAMVFELIRYRFKQNPITGKEILRHIRVKGTGREKKGANLRSVINTLRDKGFAICAGSKGYYYPMNTGELDEYVDDFQSRIDQQQQACDALKTISQRGKDLAAAKKENTEKLKIDREKPDQQKML